MTLSVLFQRGPFVVLTRWHPDGTYRTEITQSGDIVKAQEHRDEEQAVAAHAYFVAMINRRFVVVDTGATTGDGA